MPDLTTLLSKFLVDLYAGNVGSTTTINTIRTADGTAAAPPYSFTNDTGMGMFRVAAGVMGFAIAGSERARLDASGLFTVGSSGQIRWTSSSSDGSADTLLSRQAAGIVRSNGGLTAAGTSGIGYTTGAGGTVTQATDKTTGVTLNTACGQITTANSALAAGAKATFTVTCSACATTDIPFVAIDSGGTANAYRASVAAVGAGSFAITIENITAGSLTEQPVISFAIFKGVTA